MNFCTNCGTPITGTRFCSNCGSPLATPGTLSAVSVATGHDISRTPAEHPDVERTVLIGAGDAAAAWRGSTMRASAVALPSAEPADDLHPPGARFAVVPAGLWATYLATGLALVLTHWPSSPPPLGWLGVGRYGHVSVAELVALVVACAGWCAAPTTVRRKTAALALLIVPEAVFVSGVATQMWWTGGRVLGVLSSAATVAGWLVLRNRPGVSYWALAVTVAVGVVTWYLPPYGSGSTLIPLALGVVGLVGAAWCGAWLAGASERRRPAPVAATARAADQRTGQQEEQIRQWRAAYALANPGQPVPAAPPGTARTAPGLPQTNVCAILSLVLSPFSLAAIPLGHVALSQIKRTGERGHGLAIAGLVIGYLLIAVAIALGVLFVVALNDVSGYY